MRVKAALIQTFLVLTLVAGVGYSQKLEKPSDRSGHANAFLKEEVRHELATLPYYSVFDWIEAEVQPDGTVILRGDVSLSSLKGDAEVKLTELEGVTRVSNNIELLPLSINDDELRTMVYEAIYSSGTPLFKYAFVEPIHIIVKNGHVTLKGMVDNKADSDIAYIKARSVSGSFSVKNELEVQSGPIS